MEENFETQQVLMNADNSEQEGNVPAEISQHDANQFEYDEGLREQSTPNDIVVTHDDYSDDFISGHNNNDRHDALRQGKNNGSGNQPYTDINPSAGQSNSSNTDLNIGKTTDINAFLNKIYTSIFTKKNISLYTAEECVLASSQNTNIYKYKNGFIFSNTISLMIVAVMVFLYVKNTTISKSKNFCKSENIWLYFCLLITAFIASTTNFPLKFINNYKIAVYVNQSVMAVVALMFFYAIMHKGDSNE